ncbi:elongation factor G [Vallitalea okinawensis]|uniref:elongation factor G n=1 Tax=Vallitalea okinawensis TaxID=2078660 RepID=UPI000CFE1B7A|nr:elongation factor G [Vallitalea okinawensis]
MKVYTTDQVRNLALLGHGGVGKTTIAEAMAYVAGMTKRQGRVEEKNTICDFDSEENKRGFSIGASMLPVEWDNNKINVLDTPGYFDFIGEVHQAMRAVDGAVIVVSGRSGVEVGTEKAWEHSQGVPRMIFVNGMDDDSASMVKVLEELKEKFGKCIAPFQVPIKEDGHFVGFVNVVKMQGRRFVKDHVEKCDIPEGMKDEIAPVREMILEAVAETDEELMEKYFMEEEFTLEEIQSALHGGIAQGEIVPVLCGSAVTNTGIQVLMNSMIKYLPNPVELKATVEAENEAGETVEIKCDEQEPVSAFVFKTIADPFIGKISLFRVMSGTLTADTPIINVNKDESERLGHIYVLKGKEQIEVKELRVGDIGAVTKLNYTRTGDTLCEKGHLVKYPPIEYPASLNAMAIVPKSKGDEDKIGTGLHKLMEEDKTIRLVHDHEMHQQLLYGVGEQHLDVIMSKLKTKFKVEIDLIAPKVAYRETIKGKAKVQGKHKKQSGGHGQYGDVHIEFEPSGDLSQPYVFEEKIFGGSVPKNYFPAVEKGLQESVLKGALAGYPVVGVKATLVDGSYHPVDSSEMAFKVATTVAFKKGMEQAKPIILEPIASVKVLVPDEYMGDIIGDLNKRRGRVLGMAPVKGKQEIEAEVPMAEMFSYPTDLRSMTQGHGYFTMDFDRYEEAPHDVQEKVIEESKKGA